VARRRGAAVLEATRRTLFLTFALTAFFAIFALVFIFVFAFARAMSTPAD
jgi:F0F1-type ATP synthase membrane subunit c/vacuolar-type H+-ATPase subunit K